MKKENENIHLFIIEQEYKRKKARQNDNEGLSRKPKTPMLTKQNHASVIQKLQEMHPDFTVFEESEPLQTNGEREKIDRLQVKESSDAPDLPGLLASLQKIRTEEQKLLKTKGICWQKKEIFSVNLSRKLTRRRWQLTT